MRKLLTVLAAATITVAAVAAPTTADARWRGWWGPALGGFAAGALIGSAFARPYYAYPYGYGPYYAYGAPAYYGYGPAYYSYPPYYGYGDRNYFGYYGARY
ncbi:MAG: hypothetical protein JO012_08440 [Hyphomicrobiales bacterium]|nr:hypothetical protein [Hyphomicrobiales bacterium]